MKGGVKWNSYNCKKSMCRCNQNQNPCLLATFLHQKDQVGYVSNLRLEIRWRILNCIYYLNFRRTPGRTHENSITGDDSENSLGTGNESIGPLVSFVMLF